MSDQSSRGTGAETGLGANLQKTADTLHENTRIAIPLGIALIIGVFVSLGIEGDTLARLLRNSPGVVLVALVLAVLGVTLPLLLSWLPPGLLKWVAVGSAVLLVGATVLALRVGVTGVGEREQPGLDLVALDVGKKSSTVQVTASALSLASDDRMLLRIVSFKKGTQFDDAWRACKYFTDPFGLTVTLPTEQPVPGARIVYWGATGPTATGTADTTYTFVVRTTKTRYACAYAVLSTSTGSDARSSTAMLDLRNLGTEEE